MAGLKFVSSRNGAPPVGLSEAIRQGLAPDGGLYVPTQLPRIDPAAFASHGLKSDCWISALDYYGARVVKA